MNNDLIQRDCSLSQSKLQKSKRCLDLAFHSNSNLRAGFVYPRMNSDFFFLALCCAFGWLFTYRPFLHSFTFYGSFSSPLNFGEAQRDSDIYFTPFYSRFTVFSHPKSSSTFFNSPQARILLFSSFRLFINFLASSSQLRPSSLLIIG